ncbi:MAG: polyprenyl synthetase family protein [Chitinophagaceae bacterium]|nr:polyprenyl synthetase family protein [Chitinophagaceae bacterium]
MHAFPELLTRFNAFFDAHHFPAQPASLYEPCSYLLKMGGKRVRPVLCMMSHELFAELNENVMNTALAIELFHNFTLMHDDIMDAAPLRRGLPTVHAKYNINTAILSGDVMNIYSYVHLNKIHSEFIHIVIDLFNKTAIEICEGQQLDMDFEQRSRISMEEYIHMISLKTSVLLATSLQLGGILAGATQGCCEVLYEFGKTLGIAFQLKDDYLDAFGDPAKTGKQVGGDILANKKTFLPIKALELGGPDAAKTYDALLARNDEQKVADTLTFFNATGAEAALRDAVTAYSEKAYALLEKVPVISNRKKHLHDVADMLLKRDY